MPIMLWFPGVGCDGCGGETVAIEWREGGDWYPICSNRECRHTWLWVDTRLNEHYEAVAELDVDQHTSLFAELTGTSTLVEQDGATLYDPGPCRQCGRTPKLSTGYEHMKGDGPYVLQCSHGLSEDEAWPSWDAQQDHGKRIQGSMVRSWSKLRLTMLWRGLMSAEIIGAQ